MASKKITYQKLSIKANTLFLNAIQNTAFQFIVYKSYWHYKFGNLLKKTQALSVHKNFIAQKPNYSAGIGHQLSNWNAGFYFAKYFNLQFAHFPFSNNKWEHLLGFGENEIAASTLLKEGKYKKIKLPRFDSEKDKDVQLTGNIIQSYQNRKVLFILAQDQGYVEQCGTFTDLSAKFFNASARKDQALFYDPLCFNIAIHIRRGDVAAMKQSGDTNWEERWLNNDYYESVLKKVLSAIPTGKKINIYLFSQGNKEDFPEFDQFENIHYCLDVNAYDSFLHMAYADILISSKSSFSYKPALISKEIKICPGNFWHKYPSATNFILADNNGVFDIDKLKNRLEESHYKLKQA